MGRVQPCTIVQHSTVREPDLLNVTQAILYLLGDHFFIQLYKFVTALYVLVPTFSILDWTELTKIINLYSCMSLQLNRCVRALAKRFLVFQILLATLVHCYKKKANELMLIWGNLRKK